MTETIECHICSQPGRLLLSELAVEHGHQARQRCQLPPRDIAHPNRQRAHTTGTSRWAS